MKEILISKWSFVRLLRLVLAVIIIVQGIITKQTALIFVGVLLATTAIFNVGCCGGENCAVKPKKPTQPNKEIEYEEVV
jgi:uncharacterized membrane protein